MSASGVRSRTFRRSMVRAVIVRVAAWAGLMAVAVGCAAPTPKTDQGARDRVELSAQLLDVADLGASRFQSAFVRCATSDAPRVQVAKLAFVRNEAVANMRSIALGGDPGRDLVDLYVWSRIAPEVFRKVVQSHPGLIPDISAETYVPIGRRVRKLAEEWIEPDRLTRIDAAIESFLAQHQDMTTTALFRLVDLKDRLDPSLQDSAALEPDDSMFSPVNDATRELERTRITAQQLLWMLARVPTAAGWEAQAQVDLALTSPELQSIRTHISDLQQRVGDLSKSIDALGSGPGGDTGLRGVMRDALVRGGLILFALVVAGTVGALLVVRAARNRG